MKVYNFANLQKIKIAAELTIENKFLTIVLGGPGLGKTFSLNYLLRKTENTFLIEVTPQDKRAYVEPWRRLARQVVGEEIYHSKCARLNFSDLIDFIIIALNSKKTNSLVLIDEAGSMSYPVLRNFRSMVDRTRKSTGYMISGPEYFRDNLNTWIEAKIQGMNELESRIDFEVTLNLPTLKEKKFVCINEGITDTEIIKSIAARSNNFRSLFREIYLHKKGIKSRFDSLD